VPRDQVWAARKVDDNEHIATARRMKVDGHTGKAINKYLGVGRATLYRYMADGAAWVTISDGTRACGRVHGAVANSQRRPRMSTDLARSLELSARWPVAEVRGRVGE
jgi:Helix-turn-helix domain of resolvase